PRAAAGRAPGRRGPMAAEVERAAQAQADALSALTNLGCSPGDAAAAVADAAIEAPEAETPDLIRAALRALAPVER
ncbi:MAG: Holliday junction branch migration protein RuvA, partial [Pseudomonadota bacterium]